MAKKFIDDIIYEGARGSHITPNVDRYLTIPENVKRCYYLEANEKLVLFELYSWAKDDGKCQIAMDLVSLKLGISERTVRTCVKKLAEKKFLQVSKQGRSNVYTFENLKDNPYLILSEFIHAFVKSHYYRSGLRQAEEWIQSVGDEGCRVWREAVVDTLAKEAKKEKFYEPYVLKLKQFPDDYNNILSGFEDELLDFVLEAANKKASKLKSDSEAVE
ncbi:helix-turn-helix domain-containing protein [Paenibacillus sp. HWE-109]|uniref:BlaI/MecI/CopY family transcriptional regulator n=1 Tax=Paenibacillus sp. HWE-109 TaxID=1306526 RepID=UPI001EE0885F|nr:BlaI/MecI/CopY family transcriptional regulator [Paenibacillus sp. HWE-109]UKS26044.1 helix-turn-helix domain-containing protein [Paenibacillus sp. HWE-109]